MNVVMVTHRLKIAGSRALVTGASRGIGADLARGLRRSGATLALVARPSEGLFGLAEELGAKAYPTDLTDHEAVAGLLDRPRPQHERQRRHD